MLIREMTARDVETFEALTVLKFDPALRGALLQGGGVSRSTLGLGDLGYLL